MTKPKILIQELSTRMNDLRAEINTFEAEICYIESVLTTTTCLQTDTIESLKYNIKKRDTLEFEWGAVYKQIQDIEKSTKV